MLLWRRFSVRAFAGRILSREKVEFLLRCAYGVIPGPIERRTVPSAGGLFPLTLVVAAHRVQNTPAGWYRWVPARAALEKLPITADSDTTTLFRTRHVALGDAAAVIFIFGEMAPGQRRYGERGYRYLLLEAGHSAQNLLLAAAAIGAAAVPLGGFDDDRVNALVRAHLPEPVALYSVVLGEMPVPG
ncbi:MAG: SagB/ThcOx family dehydrogenase [Candidatus Dormibacteria bacterium]